MRKRTLVAALAVGLLTLALIGGAVLAQTSDEDDDGASKGFAARVAEMLDLEEADVEAALEQARTDMLDEQLDAHINRLVERGVLTEEQAEEYRTWLDDRPDDLPQLGGRGREPGRHDFARGHGRFGRGGSDQSSGDEGSGDTVSANGQAA